MPQIRFIVSARSQQEDKETLRDFLPNVEFVQERVLALHPALKPLLIVNLPQHIHWQEVDHYIENFWKEHHQAIEKFATQLQDNWKVVERKFWQSMYPLFSKIFQNTYLAYLSIFAMQPLLTAKAFVVCWPQPLTSALTVVAHELIHLLVYAHIYRQQWNDVPEHWRSDARISFLGEAINALFINHSPLVQHLPNRDEYSPETARVLNDIQERWPFHQGWGENPQKNFQNFLEYIWKTEPPVNKGNKEKLAKMFQEQ